MCMSVCVCVCVHQDSPPNEHWSKWHLAIFTDFLCPGCGCCKISLYTTLTPAAMAFRLRQADLAVSQRRERESELVDVFQCDHEGDTSTGDAQWNWLQRALSPQKTRLLTAFLRHYLSHLIDESAIFTHQLSDLVINSIISFGWRSVPRRYGNYRSPPNGHFLMVNLLIHGLIKNGVVAANYCLFDRNNHKNASGTINERH